MKGSEFPSTIACSRLSDSGEDAKVKGKRKSWRGEKEKKEEGESL